MACREICIVEYMGDEGSRNLRRNYTWAVVLTAVGVGLLIGAYLMAEGLGETATGPDAVGSLVFIGLGVVVLAVALVFWISVWRARSRVPKVTAPGWYPDPVGSGRMRWWDGMEFRDEDVNSPKA